ncbi:MAG: hypothetical protein IJS47_04715 [Clostridia bacterium]|nr:hypothetical protein [Clostridia bacterium]
MKQMIKKYMESFEEKISNNKIEEEDINDFLIKISFFQHERLIHLLVTLAFAILGMLAVIIFITAPSVATLLLVVLVVALLIPYIFHYYFLENSVQKMYEMYDRLK